MPHTLPELPYASDALAPHVSSETLAFHHGAHHRAYVEKLNELLAGHALADLAVDALIRRVGEVDPSIRQSVFDNAAQHFNHSFYWKSLRPAAASGPRGAFLAAAVKSFGSLDALKSAFTKECVRHFGAGWGWLVKETDGPLKVLSTHDAGTPLTTGQTPLLVCDLWEHA